MGYTHYQRQSRSFTAQEWARITAEAKRIVAAASATIELRGPMGTGKVEINDKRIALNGAESRGEDHESFILDRKPQIDSGEKDSFAFCKTALKPYDAVVVSILHAAREIAPDALKVSSDGGDSAIKREF